MADQRDLAALIEQYAQVDGTHKICGPGGAVVRESIVMNDAVIGRGAMVDRGVVDKGAVIGDGAMTAGMAFEALDHAGDLDANLLVVLNDNKMSICPRVGGLAESLDRLHTTAASHHRVMVVETMGRSTGWVATMGGLAGGAEGVEEIGGVGAAVEAHRAGEGEEGGGAGAGEQQQARLDAIHQQLQDGATEAAMSKIGRYSESTNLGKVFPHYVQRATADDFIIFYCDEKFLNVLKKRHSRFGE